MANTLQFRYTAGTVAIQDAANGMDAEYTPLASERGADYTTETIRLRVRKSTTAAVRTAMQEVERILDRARQFQTAGVGEPVYMDYKVSGYPDTYQSEVIDAYITPQEGTTRTARVEGNAVKTMTFDLTLTRRNFWEGPVTWLPLSNANGTYTSPLSPVVFSCNDGGTVSTSIRNNYVDIAGTAIAGDLPAPYYMFFNFSGSPISELYVFANSLIASPNPRLECTAGNGGTAVADATASGGTYYKKTTPYFDQWTYSASTSSQAYAVILRTVGKPTADTKTALFTSNINFLRQKLTYVRTDSELQMVGTVFYPQSYLKTSGVEKIGVQVERNTGGTISVDFVNIAGIDAGWSYVEFKPAGRDAIIEMDGYFDLTTCYGNRPTCNYPGRDYSTPVVGPGIYLMPGRNHRIVVMYTDSTGVWKRDQTCLVTAYCRPRRLTI